MEAKLTQRQRAFHFLSVLQALGVEQVVTSPGARHTPLLFSAAELSWTLTSVIDEREAAFYALGLARAQRKPVLLMCTSGSAGAHYLPALLEAEASAIPLIVATGDRPLEAHGIGARQTCYQNDFFSSHVSLALDAGCWDDTIPLSWIERLALRLYQNSFLKPVHVNIRFREPLLEKDVRLDYSQFRTQDFVRVSAARKRVPSHTPGFFGVEDEIANAEKGLLVAGHLECGEQALEAVGRLIQKLGWPVIAEPTSNLRRFEGGENIFASGYDALLRNKTWAKSMQPDVVIRLGRMPVSRALNNYLEEVPAMRLHAVVGEYGKIDDPICAAAQYIASSVENFASTLAELLSEKKKKLSPWCEAWKNAVQKELCLRAQALDSELWEGSVAFEAAKYASQTQAILHIANSMPMRDVDAFAGAGLCTAYCLSNRGLNGIDGTLSTAFGEASAFSKPLVVLCGDVAFTHNMNALPLVHHLKQAVTVIVVDNSGGAIFEHLPLGNLCREQFEKLLLTPPRIEIEGLSKAFGWAYSYVETYPALCESLSAKNQKPCIVHVKINRSENLEKHRAFWRAVAQGVIDVSRMD